jgi:HlyD family secretion protein
VTSLVEGIVEELLVVEGDYVEKGQPVARLIEADARLALDDSESSEALAQAELNIAKATLAAAKRTFEHPVHLEAPLAEADAAHAKLNTEIGNLPYLLQVAQARRVLAEKTLESKRIAAEAISGRSLQTAERELDEAQATVAELKQRGPALQVEAKAWERRCDALKRQLELRNDERRQVEEAEASVKAAEARVKRAQVAVMTARLRLERMTVHAPISGKVLSVISRPGRRLSGLTAASEQDASTVVTMYDPKELQVRADVRLEEVGQVIIGQPVQITTAAIKERIRGEVIAITSQADIQKNTLQVKVAIHDPPAVIRPEMLAQVTFLAPETKGEKSDGETDPLRMLVPRELVNARESGADLWVADVNAGVARLRSVQLGQAGTDELIEVTSGLTALDKLIASGRESLADGDRIRVSGMDASLGRGTAAAPDAPSTRTASSK